jgi:hypothetical protein
VDSIKSGPPIWARIIIVGARCGRANECGTREHAIVNYCCLNNTAIMRVPAHMGGPAPYKALSWVGPILISPWYPMMGRLK